MANTFDLATGVVTFKGDFDTFEKDITKAEEKVEGLNKALNDGSFRMAASAAAGINKEMEKAQKATKRMMDEIRLGKMGVLLRDAATGMSKFAASLRSVAMVGSAAGAGALGLAAVASPVASDTLQKSLKLAAATIGKDFIPMIAQVSFAIQDATRAWEQMNPAIKSAVVEMTKVVAMAGAAAVSLLGLGKVLSWIKAHPVLATATAGVGIGTAINEGVNQLGGLQAARARRAMGQDFSFVRDDARTNFFKNRKDGMTLAQEDYDRARSIYNEKAKASNAYQEGFGGGNILGGLQRSFDLFGWKQRQLINETETAGVEMMKTRERFNEVRKSRGMKEIENPLQASGGGLVSFLGNAVKEAFSKGGHMIAGSGPSSYTSLQEFYRSFNVAATSGDVFDQKMLDIAQKSLQQFQEMNQKIGALVPAQ